MKKRRILAMVLSLAMVMTAVPVSVFGEEADALIEDEVLVEEAAPVEEAVEPVEAAPEEDAPENTEPETVDVGTEVISDDLLIEDAEMLDNVKTPLSGEEGAAEAESGDNIVVDFAENSEENGQLAASVDFSGIKIKVGNGVKSVTFDGTKIQGHNVLYINPDDEPVYTTFDPKLNAGKPLNVTVSDDNNPNMSSGSDYTISQDNAHAGEYNSTNGPSVKIEFKGTEYGDYPTITIKYTMKPFNLSGSLGTTFDLIGQINGETNFDYNGHVQHPKLAEVEAWLAWPYSTRKNTRSLTAGEDFVIKEDAVDDYVNVWNPAWNGGRSRAKRLWIEGIGNYTGSEWIRDVVFYINPKELTPDDVEKYIKVPADKTYYVHADWDGSTKDAATKSNFPNSVYNDLVGGISNGITGGTLDEGGYTFGLTQNGKVIDSTYVNGTLKGVLAKSVVDSMSDRDIEGILGEYIYKVNLNLSSSTWAGNFTYDPDKPISVEGKFYVKLHPELTSLEGTLQRFMKDIVTSTTPTNRRPIVFPSDLQALYPDYKAFFTYDGVDKLVGIDCIVHYWLKTYWKDDFGVEVSGNDIVNAGDHTVTLTGVLGGKDTIWGTGSVDLSVHVEPKELSNGQANDFAQKIEGAICQYQHSNGKYEDGSPLIKVTDKGLNLPAPKNEKTLEYLKDYTYKENRNESEQIVSVQVQGLGNYKSTVNGQQGWFTVPASAFSRNNKMPMDDTGYLTVEMTPEAKKRLHFNPGNDMSGGGAILFNTSDFIVTEKVKSTGQTVGTIPDTEYNILYADEDGQPASYPTTNAGHHVVYVQIKDTSKYANYYDTNRTAKTRHDLAPCEYDVTGTPFGTEFVTKVTSLDSQQPFVELDVKEAKLIPEVFRHDYFDEAERPERFNYTYWTDANGNGTMDKSEVVKKIKGSDLNSASGRSIQFDKPGNYTLSISPNRSDPSWFGHDIIDDGPLNIPFIVNARDLEPDLNVVVTMTTTIEWPGHPVTKDDFRDIVVKDIGTNVSATLVEGTDYTIELEPNPVTEIGSATIKIIGTGSKYQGTKSIPVTIKRRNLIDANVSLIQPNVPYADGESYSIPSGYVKVELKNADGTIDEVEKDEYKVEFSEKSGIDVGKKFAVVVTAVDDKHYVGSIESSDKVTVVKGDISGNEFELHGLDNVIYDGIAHKPAVTVYNTLIKKEVDPTNYDITFDAEGFINAGTYNVTVTAKDESNYVGLKSGQFIINRRENTLPESMPPITLNVGETIDLPAHSAYGTLAYTDPKGLVTVTGKKVTGVKAGTSTLTIATNGNENYLPDSVTVAVTVVAVATPIDDFTVTLGTTSYVYDGTAKMPTVTVAAKDGAKLTADTDYTVVYSDNTNAGEATVTITGKGNYSGSIVVHFTIAKADNKITLKVPSATKYYSAVAQTTTKLAGATATSGTVTYSSSNPDMTVNPTTGAITINAKAMGRTTITVTAAESKNYKSATATAELTVQPKKVKLQSVKNSKGKAKLTWSKAPDCSGYVVKLSSAKTFKSDVEYVWVKKENASSARFIKHMQKGKTYYFKVKVYKNIPGQKKVYSVYSNVKSLKIAK